MDPELLASLNAYMASIPAYSQEYNRVRTTQGDKRSAAEWLYDHLSSSPQELQQFQGFVNNGNSATASAPSATDGSTGAVPLEQDLLSTVTQRGYADTDLDAQRRAKADALLTQIQPAYDANGKLINDLSNGNLLATEQAALGKSNDERLANLNEQVGTVGADQNTQTTRQLSDLDTYRTGVSGNIDTEVAALRAGLDPVLAARLNSAGTQEAAVNLGVQDARDRAVAQDALKGFVGGSSTLDQTLARASIAGRQQAAGIRGDAQLANATDTNNLDTYAANQRRSLGDTYQTDFRGINDDAAKTAELLGEYGAGERRTIKDSTATGGVALTENDINRRLSGLALPTTFANDQLTALKAGDSYANSGLDNFLTRLNWFSSGGTPPSATPTSTQAFDTGLPALGAGVANLGTQFLLPALQGSLNPGAGSKTTYADFLKNNPTSSAVVGQ